MELEKWVSKPNSRVHTLAAAVVVKQIMPPNKTTPQTKTRITNWTVTFPLSLLFFSFHQAKQATPKTKTRITDILQSAQELIFDDFLCAHTLQLLFFNI